MAPWKPKKSMAKRRKGYRPKRKSGRKMVLVNRALQPFPQRYIAKLKYSEIFTTNQGLYSYNLNSLWDPNRTGVGHKPYGMNQLTPLYNRYRVISCGYRIQPVQTGATGAQSIQLCALPSNEVNAIFSLQEARENPRAKYVTQSIGGNMVTLSGKVYIPSLFGRNKTQYMSDDRYQAETNASPVELALLNIYTAGTGTDLTTSCVLQILLEYTVEFFDVKTLGSS